MEGLYKLLPAKPAKLPNRACLAGRSLYGPSMSDFLGFQTKYLQSLRHTCSSCAVSFAVPFNFIRFLISALWIKSTKNVHFLQAASALNHYESAGPIGGIPGGRPSLSGGQPGGPPGGNGSAAYHLSTLGRSSSVRGRDPLLPTSSGKST